MTLGTIGSDSELGMDTIDEGSEYHTETPSHSMGGTSTSQSRQVSATDDIARNGHRSNSPQKRQQPTGAHQQPMSASPAKGRRSSPVDFGGTPTSDTSHANRRMGTQPYQPQSTAHRTGELRQHKDFRFQTAWAVEEAQRNHTEQEVIKERMSIVDQKLNLLIKMRDADE